MQHPIVELGEVCSIGDGAHAKVTRQTHGVLYLTSKNIREGYLDLSSVDYISAQDYERLFSAKSAAVRRPQPGDVLIGIIGTFGTAYRYKDSDFFGVSSSVALLRPDPVRVDPDFLLYVAKSPYFTAMHSAYKAGSVQGYTNIPTLKRLQLPLPPLSEQRRIAAILSGFDDKIELNRRMNPTLEATARALFKSWFVDFDPVRAKMEGRQPEGMDAETAALFPDRLVESPLGEIPEGWRVGSFGEDFKLTMGQSPPGETYNETGDGLPFYQGNRDFGFRYPSRRIFCTQPLRIAEAGDTLVSVRAPVGDLNMAIEKCCVGRGVGAVRHKSGSRSYTYYAMSTLKSQFANFEGEGTVFGSISGQDFKAIVFLIPLREIVSTFDAIVSTIDQQIEINERESFTLATTRDALLPKLVSGQVRVGDEA